MENAMPWAAASNSIIVRRLEESDWLRAVLAIPSAADEALVSEPVKPVKEVLKPEPNLKRSNAAKKGVQEAFPSKAQVKKNLAAKSAAVKAPAKKAPARKVAVKSATVKVVATKAPAAGVVKTAAKKAPARKAAVRKA